MSRFVLCECGAQLVIDASQMGRVVQCPQCQKSIQIPADESESPPPPPVPSKDEDAPASVPVINVDSDVRPVSTPSRSPSRSLRVVAAFMMAYGAINAGLSCYVALQMRQSTELMSEMSTSVGAVPDVLNFGNFFYHAEKLQYLTTALCLIFGGLQFAGGLSASQGRCHALAYAGAVTMMVPCLGSAFPLFFCLAFPIGLSALVLLVGDSARVAAINELHPASEQQPRSPTPDAFILALRATGVVVVLGVLTMGVLWYRADSAHQARSQGQPESGSESLLSQLHDATQQLADRTAAPSPEQLIDDLTQNLRSSDNASAKVRADQNASSMEAGVPIPANTKSITETTRLERKWDENGIVSVRSEQVTTGDISATLKLEPDRQRPAATAGPSPEVPIVAAAPLSSDLSLDQQLQRLRNPQSASKALQWLARHEPDDAERSKVLSHVLPLLASSALRPEARPVIARWLTHEDLPLVHALLRDRSRADVSSIVDVLFDSKETTGEIVSVVEALLPVLSSDQVAWYQSQVFRELSKRELSYEDVPALIAISKAQQRPIDSALLIQLALLNDPRSFPHLPSEMLEEKGPLAEPALLQILEQQRLQTRVDTRLYESLAKIGTTRSLRVLEGIRNRNQAGHSDYQLDRCIDSIRKSRRRPIMLARNRWETFLTRQAIDCVERLVQKRKSLEGEFPDEESGNRLIRHWRDGWGRRMQYNVSNDGRFAIRSAGPNGRAFDNDDILEISPTQNPEDLIEATAYLNSGDISKQQVALGWLRPEAAGQQQHQIVAATIPLLNNSDLKADAELVLEQFVDGESASLLQAAATDYQSYPLREKDFVECLVRILATRGDASTAPFLIHPDSEIQRIAKNAMAQIDVDDSPVVPQLIQTLQNRSTSETVQQQTLLALNSVVIKDEEVDEVRAAVHPVLRQAANRAKGPGAIPRNDVGSLCLAILEKVGFESADLPVLFDALNKYRQAAGKGLIALSDEPEVLKHLGERIKRPDTTWTDPAFNVLREIGPTAEETSWNALGHRDDSMRRAAIGVLSMIGGDASLPYLQKLESDPSENVRKAAFFAINKIKVTNHQDRQALNQLVDQLSIEFDSQTVFFLRSLGTGAESLLWDSLNTPEARDRQTVCRTLEQIGSERSLSRLEPLLNDSESAVVRAAKSAIAEIKTEQRVPIELWSN